MGGLLSNFQKRNNGSSKENLQGDFQDLDENEDAVLDGSLKKKAKWWERILFDKYFRITYVVILGVILGLVIPMILFMEKLEKEKDSIYGSCLIDNNARVECLINSEKQVDEDSCMKALCCWENSDTLPFKCYHSLPSAYFYSVDDIQNDLFNNMERKKFFLSPKENTRMASLHSVVYWESSEHLVVEMYDPAKFPERGTNKKSKSGNERFVNYSGISQDNENKTIPFKITWAENGNFFYLKIARIGTNETIFDTRLGPIWASENHITFSTVLPTNLFYGIRGGQGSLSTNTFGLINGFETLEFPFYMSYEKSGSWHGVLIDTAEPLLAQVMQAPGITFYSETGLPEIKLHFFAGPDQSNVVTQLHGHIRKSKGIQHEPVIPPYWGLGLHLCRKLEDNSEVLADLKRLLEVEFENRKFPYDTDCIDEYLRDPFFIANTENLTDILNLLNANSKKLLISQKVTASSQDRNENQDFPIRWLLDPYNTSNPFTGVVNNKSSNYMDFFHPELNQIPIPIIISDGNKTNPTTASIYGFALTENFPILSNSSSCRNPFTRIEAWFSNPITRSSGAQLNSDSLWGSVCPEVLHNIDGKTELTMHYKMHNVYGEQSLKLLYENTDNNQSLNKFITSDSIWTSSMYYGGFNGLQVPFTWQGLQESVAHTVRNYALTPISGTPICGANIFNVNVTFSEDLCLRWFQFGLVLPISRNSYDGASSYGPVHFSEQYRDYLSSSIRNRYMFAPYYYTTLREYQETLVPYLRPMSFHFNDERYNSEVVQVLDQFMVGEAMTIAPIIDRGVTRRAYFPPGKWFTKEGLKVWDNENNGRFQQISGYISETPMFFRGGYIIPTLESPNLSNPPPTSIEDPIRNNNYTLLVLLSSMTAVDAILMSRGSLTVKVDVASPDNDFHELQFIATYFPQNKTFQVTINSLCGPGWNDTNDEALSSTTIDQVRVLGFSDLRAGAISDVIVSNENEPDPHPGKFDDYGDHGALRLYELNIDWCRAQKYEIIVKTMIAESFSSYKSV